MNQHPETNWLSRVWAAMTEASAAAVAVHYAAPWSGSTASPYPARSKSGNRPA